MEDDALTQIELDLSVAFPLPRGGQQRVKLAGLIVEKDKAVPPHMPHDDEFTGHAEIGVDNGDFLVGGPIQCVIRLTGHRRHGSAGQKARRKRKVHRSHQRSPPRDILALIPTESCLPAAPYLCRCDRLTFI